MYLKNSLIQFLKVKNVIFLILGVAFTAWSVSNMTQLAVYYSADWYLVMQADIVPASIAFFFIGLLHFRQLIAVRAAAHASEQAVQKASVAFLFLRPGVELIALVIAVAVSVVIAVSSAARLFGVI